MKSNILVLQARCGSKRLPGKVLKEIDGKPLIGYQIERILQSKFLQDLVVAIPLGKEDDVLYSYLKKVGVRVYRGEEINVFSRFKGAISSSSAEIIVRSTADCPLFMSTLLDEMLLEFENANVDYMSNSLVPSFPDGLDIEIFKRASFELLGMQELSVTQKEHVTLGFYDGTFDFRIKNHENRQDLSRERWTVDYQEDFDFVSHVFSTLGEDVGLEELVNYLRAHPEQSNKRSHKFRNIALSKKEESHE